MPISEVVRAPSTEKSQQEQTYSQNLSTNWENRKVSILSPAADGLTIGATAIAVAATALTGGVTLAAFVIGGLAIAAGLGSSLFFAFRTPKPLEESRMENITSQTSKNVPTIEEILARGRDSNWEVHRDPGPYKEPTIEEIIAGKREESMPKVESVETENSPVVEQPTATDKPQVFDDILQEKEQSSFPYGKIALGMLGLAAATGAVVYAYSNGISPMSYFSSPGNIDPTPGNVDPTQGEATGTQTENPTCPVTQPAPQSNNGSTVFTPTSPRVNVPLTHFNASLTQSTPAPFTRVNQLRPDQSGLTQPPVSFNDSLPVTPDPRAEAPVVQLVQDKQPEITPLRPDQCGLTQTPDSISLASSYNPFKAQEEAAVVPTPITEPAPAPVNVEEQVPQDVPAPLQAEPGNQAQTPNVSVVVPTPTKEPASA